MKPSEEGSTEETDSRQYDEYRLLRLNLKLEHAVSKLPSVGMMSVSCKLIPLEHSARATVNCEQAI